jgi:Uma2 family endonuclease
MGNLTAREALSLRWAEVANDPLLRDLPYKVELNRHGKIEMSPANNRHARLQGYFTVALAQQLPDGAVLTECPVLTEIGVRVPDVAWASAAFLERHGDTTPFPAAPEICVEIVSPSNSDEEMREKIAAYLNAGAEEVWLVHESGRTQFFDRTGETSVTRFGLRLDPPPPAAKR